MDGQGQAFGWAPQSAADYGSVRQPPVALEKNAYGTVLHVNEMFPTAFTLVSALAFLTPMYMIVWLSMQPEVAYWSTVYTRVLWVIPVIILFVHGVHVRSGVPSKPAVVMALIVPCVLLLVCANNEYKMALGRAEKLFSTDCDTFPEKAALQRSWEAAYTLYERCLDETATSSGYAIEKLRTNFRVQDCEEYQKGLDEYGKDWTYLQYLEENHFCAGWCYPGVQLWTNRNVKDDCSTFVSSVFRNFVMPHSSQIVLLMIVTLFLSALALIVLGPVLRAHGIDW